MASESEKEALKGLKDNVLISQFVAGARSQSVRLELRRLELAGTEQTFSKVRDSALDLFKDIEKTKVKRGQIRHVHSKSPDGFEEESDSKDVEDCHEARVDGVSAQNSAEGPMQKLLQSQHDILKCLMDQQGQIAKQQEQISKMMEQVLVTCNSQSSVGTEQRRPIKCFGCGRYGHIRANCRFKTATNGVSFTDRPSRGQGPPDSDKPKSSVENDQAQLNLSPPRL